MTTIATPLALPCGAVLSNRLAKAALTEGLADPMNRATPELARLYQTWSEGGAGLLITGNVQIDRSHLERPGNVVIDGDSGLEELAALAAAGRCGGNHFWMQINHPGRQVMRHINPEPIAPSPVPLNMAGDFAMPRAASEGEIVDLIARFGDAAAKAKTAGFTGVQLHSAHGYLLSQFLSPLSNRRVDRWGGALDNRARFLLEAVRAIRAAVGVDYPLSVKLNSADFQKGGFSESDSVQVVRWLAAEGIDLLEISGGNHERPSMAGTDVKETTRKREAYFIEFADRLRADLSLPLMVTGGFRSREAMDAALDAGAADMIGLGRPLCIEPDLPRRLLDGTAPQSILTEELEHSRYYGLAIANGEPSRTPSPTFYYSQLIHIGRTGAPLPDQPIKEAHEAFLRHETQSFGALEAFPPYLGGSAAFRSSAFSLANTCSMGLKSGE